MRNTDDITRVIKCLDYIKLHPEADYAWKQEVYKEARQLDLIPAEQAQVGCNCPRNPFPVIYGGDMVEVF